MNKVKTQKWRSSLPKTISPATFIEVVNSLNSFLPSLETIDRKIRCRAIAPGNINDQEGESSWRVFEPYTYDSIEQLQCELTLIKDESSSCELHLEFRKNHIFLSVSDIDTGWCNAVFDEIERILKNKKIFTGEFFGKLYSALIRLQNIFIIAGALYLYRYLAIENITTLILGISFLSTGAAPAAKDIYRLFFPSKPKSILEDKVSNKSIDFEKIIVWVGFVSAIITIAKELITLF